MKSGNNGSVHYYCRLIVIVVSVGISVLPVYSIAQDSLLSHQSLKKLSLEELMDIEVTSVSKRPEKLAEAASAIQVITQEDIRHSGAKTLAEALRLAPNLQVAQVNSSQWAISARGFNNVLANKLLVLIDGRTVYTPLYAGVFWDVQNLLLEDIERIEVISGPGGTLWGANAVNGVINIITKNAADTKGIFAELATGTTVPVLGSLRYGGRIGENLSYRVFGTGFKMGHALDTNGKDVNDDWRMLKSGFRIDWNPSSKNKISIQGNLYGGKPNPDATDTAVIARGDNILARWNHTASSVFNLQLQAYYDHTWRDFGNGFTEDLKTYDVEVQNQGQLGNRHELTYGLNFRYMDHKVTNLELFAFLPQRKALYLYSVFFQDKLMLLKNSLDLTIGAKLEHNSYTGWEYQPNARLTLTPAHNHTLWTAVSRAVRTPARIDRDFYLYLAPNLPFISGSENFEAENVVAYELGWRSQLNKAVSLSVATFYNVYDDIRSAEPGPPPFGIPVTFDNGVKGKSYGVELAATSQLNSWWNLRGGYTWLKKDLSVKSDSKDMNGASAESNDPKHQLFIQSSMELEKTVELGIVFRYIDKLPQPKVKSYAGIDLRISWKPTRTIELSIVGQNLLDKHHAEYKATTPLRHIERGIYGKIICRL